MLTLGVFATNAAIQSLSLPAQLPSHVFHYAPLMVLGLAALMALQFKQPKAFFALLLLVVTYIALIFMSVCLVPSAERAGFSLIALLFNVNLIVLVSQPEREILSRTGLFNLGVITGQCVWGAIVMYEAAKWSYFSTLVASINLHVALNLFTLLISASTLLFLIYRIRQVPTVSHLSLIGVCACVNSLSFYLGGGVGFTLLFSLTGFFTALLLLEHSRKMAYWDSLTGLQSRRALDAKLQFLNGQFAIAMVDIDHFKKLNDQYGHQCGDTVLTTLGKELRAQLPKEHLYRYGGEEFMVIFVGLNAEQAATKMEKVRQHIVQTSLQHARSEAQIKMTISVGISDSMLGSLRTDKDEDAGYEAIYQADNALYHAKKKGRNQVVNAASIIKSAFNPVCPCSL
uniref:GGDEF domain-containing protein n=1 Tax=Thaumasiovibrio occultus TaxID=1891184 RepID=UPI00131CE025|nr:GGDEF domain-containing protein [Thaumasiovibrio occultus]